MRSKLGVLLAVGAFMALVAAVYLSITNGLLSISILPRGEEIGRGSVTASEGAAQPSDLATYVDILSNIDNRIANVIVFFGVIIAIVPFFIAFLDRSRMQEIEKLREFVDERIKAISNETNDMRAAALKEASEIRTTALAEVRTQMRVIALDALDDEFDKIVKRQAKKLHASYVDGQTEMGPVLKAFARNELGPAGQPLTAEGFARFIRFELFVLDLVGGSKESRLSALDQISIEFLKSMSISTAAQLCQLLVGLLDSKTIRDRDARAKAEKLVESIRVRKRAELSPHSATR